MISGSDYLNFLFWGRLTRLFESKDLSWKFRTTGLKVFRTATTNKMIVFKNFKQSFRFCVIRAGQQISCFKFHENIEAPEWLAGFNTQWLIIPSSPISKQTYSWWWFITWRLLNDIHCYISWLSSHLVLVVLRTELSPCGSVSLSGLVECWEPLYLCYYE